MVDGARAVRRQISGLATTQANQGSDGETRPQACSHNLQFQKHTTGLVRVLASVSEPKSKLAFTSIKRPSPNPSNNLFQLEAEFRLAQLGFVTVATIQNELLSLPESERARMIDFLWDSLSEPELKLRETAWAAESERRIDAYESGTLKARDAQAVFAEMKKGR
jgi:putative addiction module component (TIGR02574 family)